MRNTMDRDQLEALVERGLSTHELAKHFNKGQTAIRHWLKKFNLKTKNKSFANGYEPKTKVDINNQYCKNCNVKLDDNNAYYRKARGIYANLCKSCHSNYSSNKRRNS